MNLTAVIKCVFIAYTFLYSTTGYSQDTVFVAKHQFESPVRNVVKAQGNIYVKTGQKFYKWNGNLWEDTKLTFEQPYVFYNDGFYETKYIPKTFSKVPVHLFDLIPQRSKVNPTEASRGNTYFLSIGGSLFEYQINHHYHRSFHDKSVRDIYVCDTLKVVSTYSGIFINDSIKVPDPSYSSGSLDLIENRFLLSSDNLYELDANNHFRRLEIDEISKLGNVRKTILFNGEIHIQHTLSITKVDSTAGIQVLHDGYEYLDIETVGNDLWFSTEEGIVFSYDGNNIKKVVELESTISDIYALRNLVYLSTDVGVYVLETQQGYEPSLFASVTEVNGVRSDVFDNVWISSDNGLFLKVHAVDNLITFINNIEFNRGAIEYFRDTLYFGSIDGLYMIDVHEVYKQYLPELVEKKADITTLSNQRVALFLLSGAVLAAMFLWLRQRKRQKRGINQNQLSLRKIESEIRDNAIPSVDALAEHLDTNPVQLNRIFKSFDTTPGKFLKKVKLKMAFEMLNDGTPIGDVSMKVGYSAGYIRKELKTS